MLLLRRLGSVLRGRATRLQVTLGCVLGGLLGFVPGFLLLSDPAAGLAQAPGLILLLLCAVLIANASLPVFAVAVVLAKALSIPLLSVSYAIGTWLVDGPLRELFRWLCNSQVSAWFGLEYYATTGGLVLGLAFGVLLAMAANRLLRRIRGQAAAGAAPRRRMPIRILGVAAALALCTAVFTFQEWFSTPLLTENLRTALSEGNGATVDLERAALQLSDGEIVLDGLQIADRGDLHRNLFAADELRLVIDTQELLRRRFVIDEIRVVRAFAGSRRETPGVLLPSAEPAPEPEPTGEGVPTIEDYLAEYEIWKERLEQLRGWIEDLYGSGEEAGGPPAPEEPEREALGLAGVVARHLFTERPRVWIRSLDIEGITWTHDGTTDELALRMADISSDPDLLGTLPSVTLGSASGSFAVGFGGGVHGGEGVGLTLRAEGVGLASLFETLGLGGKIPAQGGTLDLDCRGSLAWSPGGAMQIELPVTATLRGTTLTLPGAGPTEIDELRLPFGLEGDIVRPAVRFEFGSLRDALLDVGKQELADLVAKHAGALRGELEGRLPSELKEVLDPNKSPEEVIDAAKRAIEKKASEGKERAKKELEKLVPGLGGLLGGKKKKKD